MSITAELIALRNLHAAVDSAAIAAALIELGAFGCDAAPQRAAVDELEYAFNRLYVGPAAPIAPPYASAWLDPDRRLMGDVTARVAGLYDALGLCSPLAGSVPDDHLALELDAWLALDALVAAVPNAPAAPAARLRRWFVDEHLARWLPAFIDRVAAAADVPPPLQRANRRLAACLAAARGADAVLFPTLETEGA